MSNQYPPPPPGYPQQGYPQQQPAQQNFAPLPPQPQQSYSTPYVDPRKVIGGWSAAGSGMETGKYVEYKVLEAPTKKGGMFKTVKFFKPYKTAAGVVKEGDSFSFNQMKELVERINHFMQNYGGEPGAFVWTTPTQQPYPVQVPQPQYPPQQPGYGAPPQQPYYGQQAAPVQQGVLPPVNQWGGQQPAQPQQQSFPTAPPPPPGGTQWP